MNTPNDPPSTVNAPPPTPAYRPKGKIAWLPKPTRDRINQMLLDGKTYQAIIGALGPEGKDLNINNLWRYHKGPYRHWLHEQHRLAEACAKNEAAAELLQSIDSSSLNQAAVQTTILQIYDAVRDVTAGDIRHMLAENPAAYARIVNALSRLTKENLSLQKHRDALAQAQAAQLKHLDPNRELSAREHNLFLAKVEQLFKLQLPKFPEEPTAPAPPGQPVHPPPPSFP